MSHKKQGLALTLTKEALEALFPAGSEAFTQLRQSVIQNFVDAHIKPGIESGIHKTLSNINLTINQEILRQMRQYAFDAKVSNSDFNAELRGVIVGIAEKRVTAALKDEITKTIDERISAIKAHIDLRVEEYKKQVDRAIKEETYTAVSKAVLESISETLKNKKEEIHGDAINH